MNTDEKKKVVTTTIIIGSFLLGSLLTNAVTDRNVSSIHPAYSQASIWSRLFGNVQQDEITEYADVIRLVLDQIEKIHELETRITVLETCGNECEKAFPPPDYDSGWLLLPKGEHLILEHNLNTMDYFVYLIHMDDESPNTFNNFGSGGAFPFEDLLGRTLSLGTMYEAEKNSIDVYRYYDGVLTDFIRVMIWKIPT
jgi:hypothetical protein